MHAALTVFCKEVRENLRDRRTVLNALVRGPFLLPVLFLVMFNLQIRAALQNAEKPLPVPVVGAAQAPHLVAALTQMGMVLKPAPKDSCRRRADATQRCGVGDSTRLCRALESRRDGGRATAIRLLAPGKRSVGGPACAT